jgi:hypothetical protein
VVIKAGVPADAPVDVLEFHRKAHLFPCDPTSNQLYTYERFDAYRALGYFSARAALDGAKSARNRHIAPPWQPAMNGHVSNGRAPNGGGALIGARPGHHRPRGRTK